MQQTLSRELLEQLVGKTVAEVSHTDADDIADGQCMATYVFFTDLTVLKCGPNTFQVFGPSDYKLLS
jgi:hypothetical protein